VSGDFNHPYLHWEFVDGDLALTDGVTIILTHGHSPGHLSLMVDLPQSGPVILAGDAIQLQANADRMILSTGCWNQTLAIQAILRLKTLAVRNKAQLWPNHDIQFWEGLNKSPGFYT
jgi:N-acyl homoserine lactone hydrolase